MAKSKARKKATRRFRIELGIDQGAATLPRTNPNMRLFPLQNSLIDLTGGKGEETSAWYSQLRAGDRLSFRLVDISNLRSLQPPAPERHPDLLKFRFTDRDDPDKRANPFTERTSDWRISRLCRHRRSPVYSLLPGQKLPSWAILGKDESGHPVRWVTFAKSGKLHPFRIFELSVAISIRSAFGWVNQFVFDPEMIVCETGGAQGC